jgi:hypothetical protein
MFSRIWQGVGYYMGRKSVPTSVSIDLAPAASSSSSSSSSPPGSLQPVKPDLNVFRNLKRSVGTLEVQLRLKLQELLEPSIYEKAIVNGRKDAYGRYVVVTTDKKDMLFYYQNVLNLLIDFQQVMGPVSDLHESFTKLIENRNYWGKVTSLWSQRNDLSDQLNTLGDYYRNFLITISELQLDTVVANLPGFEDLKSWIKLLAPVEETTAQVNLNPFYASYKQHGNEWRQLIGLPSAQDELDEEDEEDFDLPAEARWGQAGAEAMRALETMPLKMESIKDAINKILRDLSGSEVSATVKKDYEATINTAQKILDLITKFSTRPRTWANLLSFGYAIYPLAKQLMASLPQSYVSVNKVLSDLLLTTARQVNLILRDWFLYVDKLEGQFYLKEGSLLSLGQGKQGCGLFLMAEAPRADKPELLNNLLDKTNDAYVFSGDDFS